MGKSIHRICLTAGLALFFFACCSREESIILAGMPQQACLVPVSMAGRLEFVCPPRTAEAEQLASRFRKGRATGPLVFGSERLMDREYLGLVAGRRVAIMANQTSRATVDRLLDDPRITLVAIFAPEHGFWGEKAAGHKVDDAVYRGVPVHARFGGGDVTRRIPVELLQEVDVLLFEVQDVGTRHYTYISSMYLAMDSAADAGIDFVVLDRPVAVNGEDVEAPLLDTSHQTFIGVGGLPNRYAMTIGELALLFKHESALMHGPRYPRLDREDAYYNVKDLKLFIVPMSGYDRTRCFDEQDRAIEWIPTSPNIPTVDSALCYVGAGLFDGNTIGEMASGYEQFVYLSLPFVKDRDGLEAFISAARSHYPFPGVDLKPVVDRRTGRYTVIKLEVTDRARFNSSYTALALMYTQAVHYPQTEFYSSVAGRHSFTIVNGSIWLADLFSEDKELPPFSVILQRLDAEAGAFKKIREKYLLY